MPDKTAKNEEDTKAESCNYCGGEPLLICENCGSKMCASHSKAKVEMVNGVAKVKTVCLFCITD